MADRSTLAQQPPGADQDYRGFPRRRLTRGDRWFRQHDESHGAWWFSSSMLGRFDLPAPEGTCYLASTREAATRERIGPDLAATGRVAMSVLTGRVVSALVLPQPCRAANLDADRAADHFGITGELAVLTPYRLPQAWARVLRDAGFDGILARLRFTPSGIRGLALFGAGGARPDWAADPDPRPLVEVARYMGIEPVDPPNDDQLTFTRP